jgi:hypothetical protein
MLKLRSILDEDRHRFMCFHEGFRLIVTPQLSKVGDADRAVVPVTVDGVAHVLFTDYNRDNHLQDIFLHVPDGPYKDYKGPRLVYQEFEVDLETFDKHFSIVLWRRERGTLYAQQVKGIDAMLAALKEGWFREPVPEKIEDAPYIQVARDGAVSRERNPFYVPPAPEGAV